MDNLAESIRNNLLLRLKSPLIGAFCLSWIFLNLKGITLFILVDTPQRIEMEPLAKVPKRALFLV